MEAGRAVHRCAHRGVSLRSCRHQWVGAEKEKAQQSRSDDPTPVPATTRPDRPMLRNAAPKAVPTVRPVMAPPCRLRPKSRVESDAYIGGAAGRQTARKDRVHNIGRLSPDPTEPGPGPGAGLRNARCRSQNASDGRHSRWKPIPRSSPPLWRSLASRSGCSPGSRPTSALWPTDAFLRRQRLLDGRQSFTLCFLTYSDSAYRDEVADFPGERLGARVPVSIDPDDRIGVEGTDVSRRRSGGCRRQ